MPYFWWSLHAPPVSWSLSLKKTSSSLESFPTSIQSCSSNVDAFRKLTEDTECDGTSFKSVSSSRDSTSESCDSAGDKLLLDGLKVLYTVDDREDWAGRWVVKETEAGCECEGRFLLCTVGVEEPMAPCCEGLDSWAWTASGFAVATIGFEGTTVFRPPPMKFSKDMSFLSDWGKAVGLVRSDPTAIYMSRERGGSVHELGWINHRKLLLWKQPTNIWSTGYKALWRREVVYNRMSSCYRVWEKASNCFQTNSHLRLLIWVTNTLVHSSPHGFTCRDQSRRGKFIGII